MADGETRTSRVVGSVDFIRPQMAKTPEEQEAEDKTLLQVVTGVRCCMPFTIKCRRPATGEEEEVKKLVEQMENIANEIFGIVEEKLSTYNPNSEINLVNALPNTIDDHMMSEPLREVVLCTKEMVKLTRGAFDPSVAPLLDHYVKLAKHVNRRQSIGTKTTETKEGGGEKKEEEEVKKQFDESDDDEFGEEDLSEHIDMETIRRQRVVVDYLRSLVNLGFSADPADDRVSPTVRKLLDISQWSSAFSVGDRKGQDWRRMSSLHTRKSKINQDLTKLPLKIRKKHVDARLDLNGIAKGWAVDAIADRLPSPCYVEWGGDVKVRGSHPSGRRWTVAVPEPPSLEEIQIKVEEAKKAGQVGPVYKLADQYINDENKKTDKTQQTTNYLAILELRDGDAVATSGDHENVIERNGKLYSHVINPQLGRLLELNNVTLSQAVVVSKSCMVSDVLSTAAISKEDPSQARAMLDPFRTGYRKPLSDYLLYARKGPRIIRMTVPGVELQTVKKVRLAGHEPATVIVVGSGLAGMSAAIEAAEARANVILLEKEPKTGGNSAKATSGISGWGTDTQAEQGVADDERHFERDTFRSGVGGCTNHSLVRTLSSKSAPAIHWLKHKFGIPLTSLTQLGGHSTKRTHRAPPDEQGRPVPIGWKITKTLRDAIDIQFSDKIEVRCGQTVTKLIHEVDEVTGVKTVTGVEVTNDTGSETIMADSIVLATGGFGCSQATDGLMSRFRPDLLGVPTTNGAFAQGDGVVLGEELGADLIDMDKVQLHPTGFIDPKDPSNPTKYLAPEAIRGSGGVLVTSEGKRFVNELDLRSVVAAAIQKNCAPYHGTTATTGEAYVGPPFAWCILGPEAQELFGKASLGFYKDKLGLFDDCEDVSAIAKLIGCDESVLVETLDAYDEAMDLGSCPQTFKDVFPSELSAASKNLIVARVTPSIHYTMGGLNINPAGEVQERITESTVGSHRHIRGLYAAGEVTGGVHGGNRLAGNSLLECVVYGRIAGQRAASVKQPEKVMFPSAASDDGHSESHWTPIIVREVRNTDREYGLNTREVRFNLQGAFQHSGLDVGQFVAIRGEMDGETLMGYFSPITRPTDEGVIGILCRVDAKGGPITRLLEFCRPGSVLNMCAMGGLRLKFDSNKILFRRQQINRIGLLAGGTGIAPMIQIIRAYGQYVRSNSKTNPIPPGGLNLIYAAEEIGDLAYMKILEDVRKQIPDHFRFYVILNRPPLGWTEGVGFVEKHDIVKHLVYPPTEGDMVVMCGPPVFEFAMRKTLMHVGFDDSQWFSFSEDDRVSAHL